MNGTHRLIEKYEVEVRIPSGLLKHWNTVYTSEVRRNTPGRIRFFRFDQYGGRGALRPHDGMENPIMFDYCTVCAIPEGEGASVGATLVSEMVVAVTAWVEDHEYVETKTIKQLNSSKSATKSASTCAYAYAHCSLRDPAVVRRNGT